MIWTLTFHTQTMQPEPCCKSSLFRPGVSSRLVLTWCAIDTAVSKLTFFIGFISSAAKNKMDDLRLVPSFVVQPCSKSALTDLLFFQMLGKCVTSFKLARYRISTAGTCCPAT
jgi:hypothetical protein